MHAAVTLGRPKPTLELNDEEREELERWASRRKTAQALALRARIVLRCAMGLTNQRVAEELGVTMQTVGKWRQRFVERRADGLLDEPRPGAPRKISDSQIERVVRMTLESTPEDATHWSTRTMAKSASVSQTAVVRIWKTFGLQPHRTETFKLSSDPLFIEKVRDIVGLYLDPPERAVVLCVDEKSQIQALDRTQPLLPMTPGFPQKRTHDYLRHGTSTLFAALDAASGAVIGQTHRRHRSIEFKKFLDRLDQAIPVHLDVHAVLDNYGTHKTALIRRWAQRHPRFHFHFTPTSASWLNLVERFFAALTDKQIRRGTFRSTQALEKTIHAHIERHNRDPKPFIWTKTADEILDSLARLCRRISDSGH